MNNHNVQELSRKERNFRDRDKHSGELCLGSACLFSGFTIRTLILEASISTESFFQHSLQNVTNYLSARKVLCAEFYSFRESNVEICCIEIDKNGVYTVILKTFWLKMLQQNWRKKYQKHLANLKWRKDNILLVLRNTERYGRPYSPNQHPYYGT